MENVPIFQVLTIYYIDKKPALSPSFFNQTTVKLKITNDFEGIA